eukprot:TRINITY_DN9507_c0_g1_i1.p1 TRINITY_DN9507_c0_g1~~TRINITY_DN9507_c0_g1_i1.p1  ORF type:complete len:143 (+),score=31.15 TRINITY_DN9507_c0_g1_i1:75-503(+)
MQPQQKTEYTKVKDLTPSSMGVNLRVRAIRPLAVLTAPDPLHHGSRIQIAEVLVGDETGCIAFCTDQRFLDVIAPGNPLLIRYGHVEMSRGFMRLTVSRWGSVAIVADQAPSDVNEAENMSAIEYEKIELAAHEGDSAKPLV